MAANRQQPHGGKPKPLVDRYTYITSVKAGSRTIAWLAIDRTNKRVVVAAPVGKARLLSLKHVKGLAPGHLAPIVRLLRTPDSTQLPADLGSTRPVGIAIADYVPGDTLHARLKLGKLNPIDAVNLCAHMVRAVRAMHKAGTAHGAISPRAVVTSPKGKWSAPVVTQLIAPTSGAFSSRERLQKRGPSFEDDSWAAHATLHAALTAEGPFAGKTREELLQNMFGSKPRRLDQFGVNEPELQRIIDRGLVTNPRYRATLEQLEKSLEKWLEEKGKQIQSLPPESGGEAMFPKEDARAIVFSEPPASGPGSSAFPLPRPHGKSLVGIVIDEPIDADAPAFAPPQRPEDLLDAVDDEDDDGGRQDEEEDATQIYDPGADKPLPALGGSASAESLAPAATEDASARTDGVRASGSMKPTSHGVSGSGQALAAALALAVAALVALFVRFRSDEQTETRSAKPASSEQAPAEEQRAACVASFFPADAFDVSEDFGFLCRTVDLRSTAKELEKRVLASGDGVQAPAAQAWQSLGWFELPLVASLRHSCCETSVAERIVLPQPPPSCKSLSAVLKKMTAPPFSPSNLSARAVDFERAVECLAEEKQASAYGYEDAVAASNRQALREFLERGERARRN